MKTLTKAVIISLAVVLLASLATNANAAKVPNIASTSEYKSLVKLNKAFKSRAAKNRVTPTSVKAGFYKKVTTATKKARKKAAALSSVRTKNAKAKNRKGYNAEIAGIEAIYKSEADTLNIEFAQTRLDIRQEFAASIRSIKEEWAEKISPFNKRIRKAMKKLKIKKNTKKVRKAKRNARQTIAVSKKKGNYWRGKRGVFLKEERAQFNLEIMAAKNDLKLDLEDNARDLKEDKADSTQMWKEAFDEVKTRLIGKRSFELRSATSLQRSANSYIRSMPTTRAKRK